MLIDPQRARDLKVELFEAATIEGLQDELQEWLDTRDEEEVLGLSFETTELGAGSTYIAHVLYTE